MDMRGTLRWITLWCFSKHSQSWASLQQSTVLTKWIKWYLHLRQSWPPALQELPTSRLLVCQLATGQYMCVSLPVCRCVRQAHGFQNRFSKRILQTNSANGLWRHPHFWSKKVWMTPSNFPLLWSVSLIISISSWFPRSSFHNQFSFRIFQPASLLHIFQHFCSHPQLRCASALQNHLDTAM